VANHLVLEAKIREMEHALQVAISNGDMDRAALWNSELIFYLVRLTDAIGNSKSDNGADQ
jgi:hypothetical protein